MKFPISYIGSDNTEGGRIAAARARQSDWRERRRLYQFDESQCQLCRRPRKGLQGGDDQGIPQYQRLGPDYNLDDPNKATQQTAAVLEREPQLAGVFGTNVFSARAPARRSSMRASAVMSRSSLMTQPSWRSNR